MKTLLHTLLLLICCLQVVAQDIIVKRNADEINAKILEITPEVVKYKRFDYLDGPTISLAKSEIFMIKYANGTKEVITAATAPSQRPALANQYQEHPMQQVIKLAGPRVGFTLITGAQVQEAREEYNLSPFITQFGWQFETRIFTTSNGLSGLVEFVPLIGGLEQGKFIPSLNGIIGLRGAKGFEFGIGPNLTPTGAGLALALGTNFHTEGINFPVNLAVVPSNSGARFSLLFGFNSRKY
ncbi:hypothetical protein [Rufibacter roseus]|uniref:GLPGLI family protein n=1 Tax=Rufibacter roseus TaxID=1567108 RepID=A0ABW2DPY1_9BACT|nr:hypothetical protein [Rufibacter roseus]